jgi:hypothetical protein
MIHERSGFAESALADMGQPLTRGLHSLTSQLNLRTLGNASLTLELILSTIGTHPRVDLGHIGDKVSFS